MLAVRLDPETGKRLENLARKTGRPMSFIPREAILEHLDDLEDYYLAADAVRAPGRTYSGEEAKHELGLSD